MPRERTLQAMNIVTDAAASNKNISSMSDRVELGYRRVNIVKIKEKAEESKSVITKRKINCTRRKHRTSSLVKKYM